MSASQRQVLIGRIQRETAPTVGKRGKPKRPKPEVRALLLIAEVLLEIDHTLHGWFDRR